MNFSKKILLTLIFTANFFSFCKPGLNSWIIKKVHSGTPLEEKYEFAVGHILEIGKRVIGQEKIIFYKSKENFFMQSLLGLKLCDSIILGEEFFKYVDLENESIEGEAIYKIFKFFVDRPEFHITPNFKEKFFTASAILGFFYFLYSQRPLVGSASLGAFVYSVYSVSRRLTEVAKKEAEKYLSELGYQEAETSQEP